MAVQDLPPVPNTPLVQDPQSDAIWKRWLQTQWLRVTSAVTNSTGALTANRIILGNGGSDIKAMASLGTTTTVLHGNAAGAPTFGAVSLTADVSGTLPYGNGGTGATSFANHGVVTAGATALTTVAPGTSGNVLTSNGTDWTSAAEGHLGTVTSVNVTSANGVSATGGPITTSGSFTFTLAAITPTTVAGTDTTDSSSSTTGAFKTAGGMGIAKSLYVGNNIGIVATTATAGIIYRGTDTFIHSFSSNAIANTNVYIGAGAGNLTSTSLTDQNIGIGGKTASTNAPLGALTTGFRNTIVGFEAGGAITSGTNNFGMGWRALLKCTTGTFNVGTGRQSLRELISGADNCAYGTDSGIAITTASANSIFGDSAGGNVTTGSSNLILGSGVNAPSATGNKQLNIHNIIFGINGQDGTVAATATPTATGAIGIGTTVTNTLGNLNRLQVAGIDQATGSVGVSEWSADALGARIEGGKSRGAAIGTNTIVQSGDIVFTTTGYGATGSGFQECASWEMGIDGTPGASNDMPGFHKFYTTPDGSGTRTLALKLGQDQKATFSSTITAVGGATFLTTSTALTNGAGVGLGTLTNAPAAGDPTKWIGINDNGTTRYVPAW